MTVFANPYIAGGQIASSLMLEGIKQLYNIANDINDFIDKHIEDMKSSDNQTIARTGRVLDAAKYGFGMGYISSVTVIAVGQLLLGNSLSAVTTVATSVTLSNPIAMTCAAVGAIYYGWNALTDQEKDEILEKLSKGLDIGIEMIKSVIRFILDKTKEMWTSENITQIKVYIKNAAESFGKTISYVTRTTVDKVSDQIQIVKDVTGNVTETVAGKVSDGMQTVKDATGTLISATKENAGKLLDTVTKKTS